MFLKEKRDGSINGSGEADKRKQQEKIEPIDATSTTVTTEAVMLIAKIDSLEGRYVAVIDKTGACFSADMYNKVHVLFIGAVAALMVAADPALYRPFVSYYTGQAVLYV